MSVLLDKKHNMRRTIYSDLLNQQGNTLSDNAQSFIIRLLHYIYK